jgi:two-component system OmpR family response regulator
MAGIQILVVEDDPLQSKLVSFLLEEAGHTIRIAESAEKALEVLQSFRLDQMLRPDLILLDIQLPGRDGLEFTRELRRTPIHDNTPIIALTGYTDPLDLARAREAGCSGIISKPIDTASFARQVRKLFGGAMGGDRDVPSDSSDLLAGMRNTFLGESLEQCRTILKELKSSRAYPSERFQRVLHRWAGMGGTLGFLEIAIEARRVEILIASTSLQKDDVVRAFETAQRRFFAATRSEPALPLALIRGLRDVRIGLANFSEQEANRMRSAADRSNVRVTMERINLERINLEQINLEQIKGDSIDQSKYGAVVVNECSVFNEDLLHRTQWSVPAVFIGSRSSLESLCGLPLHAHDFLIAPWEAEEVLLRVHRLIASAAPAQPAWDSPHMQRRRPRVLIADDDPDLVLLVSGTLEQSGMDCEVARSGQQTLDTARRHPPDAIVLDVNMIDLDGFEVLKKLRQNLSTASIPVLLLTARSQESDITRGVGSGADDYVVKPFDPADLASRVDKIISTTRKAFTRV